METKVCRVCLEKKEFELLVPSGKSKKTGEILRKNICKKCWNKKREESRKANYTEARFIADRRRWKAKNASETNKDYRLKLYYGITFSQYQDMIKEQNNKCKICSKELIKPHVDHDHGTGKVRSILCSSCNTMLGLAGDDIEILKNAIKYLNEN